MDILKEVLASMNENFSQMGTENSSFLLILATAVPFPFVSEFIVIGDRWLFFIIFFEDLKWAFFGLNDVAVFIELLDQPRR